MTKRSAGTALAALLLAAGCRTPDLATLRADRRPAASDHLLADAEAPERRRSDARDSQRRALLDELQAAEQDYPRRDEQYLEETLALAHRAAGRGRVAEAEDLYHEVLQLDPTHPEAHHRLAVFADQRQDFRAAGHHYAHALTGKPHDADLLNDMGYSAMLQGRTQDAEAYLQRALECEPTHQRAMANLKSLYGLEGHPGQEAPGPQLAASQADGMAGPPPGADPTAWLRQQMDEARRRDLAQRQPPMSPMRDSYPASQGVSPAISDWNPQPSEPPPYYPYGPAARDAVAATHSQPQPINDVFRAIDQQRAPAAAPAGGYRSTVAAYPPAYGSSAASTSPQITPGQPGSGLRRALPVDEPGSWGREAAPSPADGAGQYAVNRADYYGGPFDAAASGHDARSTSIPVASWDAQSTRRTSPPVDAPLGVTAPTFPSPHWPAAPSPQVPSVPTPDAARAAQIGMDAGPGGMFPGVHHAAAATPSAAGSQWPNPAAGQQAAPTYPGRQMSYEQPVPAWPHSQPAGPDPLDSFQQSVRRQHEELEQVRRQLEAARQMPPVAGTPHPTVPQGYNSLPPQWPQSTPQQWPQGNTAAASGYAPPDYQPGPYEPPPYAPPSYDAARR